MSKTKELRELIDKVKDDISVQIDTIVEWNLDNSDHVQDLYRLSKDKIGQNDVSEFNEMFQDSMNYIKVICLEELFHEYTLQNNDNGDNIIKKENE
tara:strand:+ start:211 stop:498 length:288 start_codon:yes stop_codon:yes gene_type:complete